MVSVLRASSRDTDVIGWYKDEEILGVMFTGLLVTDKSLILTTILTRVSDMLRHELTFEQFNRVSLSFHFFPDDWDQGSSERPSNTALYPDLMNPGKRKRGLLMLKRAIDAMASGVGLLLLSPLFLIIAAAIKLTSARARVLPAAAGGPVRAAVYDFQVPIDVRQQRSCRA